MLAWLGIELVSCTRLQTLWAGYGHICAITARPLASSSSLGSSPARLILKLITPPDGSDEGHLRKMLSYEVEQVFYTTLAPSLAVPVAACLASTYDLAGREGSDRLNGVMAMLLADLRPAFPVAGAKRGTLTSVQVHAALSWLARFHGASRSPPRLDLGEYLLPPLEEAVRRARGSGGDKLWLNGGYTYLATRRGELADLAADSSSEWSAAFCAPDPDFGCSVADAVARVLIPRGRACESVIHGDVKSENLFSNRAGDEVAFFDFQYVGLGIGACDLAKLFTCSVPMEMLADDAPSPLGMQAGERQLLETYRATMLQTASAEYAWETFERHWETALVDWCRFQASWGFWGNTEWLEARVRHILADEGWRAWLKDELREA